jgi:signal transduction histidine kinase
MRLLEFFRSQIRYKIILPYLALTLFVMTVGAAISTALVSASWQDRLINEVAQAGRNTTDALALRERDVLNFMFVAANGSENPALSVAAVPDVVASRNAADTSLAMRPYFDSALVTGINFSRMIVFDRQGVALIDWLTSPGSAEPAVIEGTVVAEVPQIRDILQGVQVNGDDKFSGLIVFQPDPQPYFFTVVPIKQDETVVGGLIMASKTDEVLDLVQQSNRAAITSFYGPDGQAFGSTLLRRADELPNLRIAPDVMEALRTQRANSVFDVEVRGQEFLFGYSPLQISGSIVGFFSVGLSRDFQIQNLLVNRNLITGITVVLTAASILIGLLIARMINRPLTNLVDTASAVTAGDLERRSDIQGDDEIGQLSRAFNQMTDHLLRLYRTSQDLGVSAEVPAVLDVSSRTLSSLVPGAEALAWLEERGSWRYWFRPYHPLATNELFALRIPLNHALIHELTTNRAPLKLDRNSPHLVGTGLIDALQFHSLLITPLVLEERVIGALIFASHEPGAFDQEANRASLMATASMTASVLCNAVLFEQVERDARERQAILQSIADGVVVCDHQGVIILMNETAERMLKISDWRTRTVQFAHLLTQPAPLNSELFGGQRNAVHYQVGDLVLSLSSAAVVGDDGQALGTVNVLHDMSSEAEVDQAKTAFIATISHELRTPLTVITGYLDLLLRGMAGEMNTEQRELLGQVRVRADQMAQLFKNVVMVASIESNTLPTKLEPQNVHHAIETAAYPMQNAIKKKGLTLDNQVALELPDVYADREQLHLILTQLIDNARRYTEQGQITINATQHATMIQVNVCDSGAGIPPEELKRLFTRFYRVEGNSSPERGFGLGLTITRQLVERLGGQIWAQSHPGKGSVFSFTLPIAVEQNNGTG